MGISHERIFQYWLTCDSDGCRAESSAETIESLARYVARAEGWFIDDNHVFCPLHATLAMRKEVADEMPWTKDYANFLRLGKALVKDVGLNAKQLQSYYENPWSYAVEWKYLEKHGNLEGYNE